MNQIAIAFLPLIVVAAAFSTVPQQESSAASAMPVTGDRFLMLIRDIEASSFFPQMDFKNRLLTFEMLTAAETKHLQELLKKIGYITLFEYLDVLPPQYQHQFIDYSVDHLKSEITDPDQYDV